MSEDVDCRIEHIALNVPDPVAMARWYVKHLGMRVLRAQDKPPFAHFLADAAGRTVLEIYNNPAAPLPAYSRMDPLEFHIAFAVANVAGTRDRLRSAGAMLARDATMTAGGDLLAMLRDPWGVPIQLASRATPML
jgi:glyoxylase I family protein